MNKLELPTNKIGKYLREISVVVIGVAITLSLSYWIGVRNEKRDIALHLHAIKMELEENTKALEYLIERSKFAVEYTNYLWSHDEKSLNKDSLKNYIPECYSMPIFELKTNAFEMFKSSGIMRLVTDKKLLRMIWNVYEEFTMLKQACDEHNKIKWSFLEKEIPLIKMDRGQVKTDIIPMYDFYRIDLPNSLRSEFKVVLKSTKKTLSKLEETKMIKQFIASEFKFDYAADEDLDKYLGVYSSDQVPVIITITKVNKRLFIETTGLPTFPLKAIAADKFEFEEAGVILEFNPSDKTMILEQDGEIFNFVREN